MRQTAPQFGIEILIEGNIQSALLEVWNNKALQIQHCLCGNRFGAYRYITIDYEQYCLECKMKLINQT